MHTITLTADDGSTHTGKLPTSWANTPLAPYAALATATDLPGRIRALAALVGLPVEPLLHDVRHYGALVQAAPFLFGQLPEAAGPVPKFKHLGVTYAHVGPLDTINAEQMEALYNFLAESEGKPFTAGPGLLAVLYCPVGQKQTAAVVTQAQQAFATLPVAVAWPAIADFLRAGHGAAQLIGTYSALHAQLQVALSNAEAALLTSSASCRFWQRPLRSLTRQWIKSVRATLTTA